MSWRGLRIVTAIVMVVVGILGIAGSGLSQQSAERLVYSVELTGTIDPATERWIDQALGEACLLYTSDAADDSLRVDLGGAWPLGLVRCYVS